MSSRKGTGRSVGTVVISIVVLALLTALVAVTVVALARVDAKYEEAQTLVDLSIRTVLRAIPTGENIGGAMEPLFSALERLERIAVPVELSYEGSSLRLLKAKYDSGRVANEELLNMFLVAFGDLESTLDRKHKSLNASFYSLIAGMAAFLLVCLLLTFWLEFKLRVSSLEAEWSKRSLAGTLRAEEDMRRRIARELHDDAAQDIAAAKLLCERAVSAPESASERAREAADLLSSAGRTLRALALDLRPPDIGGDGLVSAVESLCLRLREFSKRDIRFSMEGDAPRLSDESAIHAYRIIQESLSNAIKHAPSHSIRVSLSPEARGGRQGLFVEVADESERDAPMAIGERVAAADPSISSGMGMTIMRERAALIGGTLSIEAGAKGYTVSCFVPAAGEEEPWISS